MKINTGVLKTIAIIILVGAIGYFFANQWFQGRLLKERDMTILQVQNEIYGLVKSKGSVVINSFEVDEEGEIKIIDNITLIIKE